MLMNMADDIGRRNWFQEADGGAELGGESAMRDAFAVGPGEENGGMALVDDGALDAAASPAREPDVDVSDAVPGESDVGGAGCIEACGADGMCEFAGDDGESGVWEESGERDDAGDAGTSGADGEMGCVSESDGGGAGAVPRRRKAIRGKKNRKSGDARSAALRLAHQGVAI